MAISHFPWPWLRSDATALAGYANMMMMMMMWTKECHTGMSFSITFDGKYV